MVLVERLEPELQLHSTNRHAGRLSDRSENPCRLQPECHIHAFMFEGRSTSAQPRAVKPLAVQFVLPVVADASRYISRQDSSFLHIDIEEFGGFDCR